MTVRIGINGFGRIGRNFTRAVLKRPDSGVELVAVNDLSDAAVLAHLLHYDSVLGPLEGVRVTDDGIEVGSSTIKVLAERDPAALPWKELGVDVVVESTGIFTDRAGASKHLEAGAQKVIISAPATDPDITIVMGVNDDRYDPAEHNIISNASCTTNSVVPMAKVLLDNFGIDHGLMTTIHAYTTEQQLQDQVAVTRKGKPDLRRMRSGALNIVPASTGAAKAASLVLPELKGKLHGMALRVPIPVGSVTDLVVELERPATAEDVNNAFKEAAASDRMKGILVYTEDPIVSSDVVGNPASCTIDGLVTMAIGGKMVKALGWYDNEWGYSNRIIDLIRHIAP
ncbi:MAG TPA: type I glyceraldehyde-3-phosphate dehydrogenase [Acidimicrobiales bacterium]|nr:type I glyceraldehyde-3-phosphate dehydrogenase [Acidimicrobiales bacterium]